MTDGDPYDGRVDGGRVDQDDGGVDGRNDGRGDSRDDAWDQGIRFLTKYYGAIILRRKINYVTAFRMLGHQPGPVSLFFLARPAQLCGNIIFSAGTRPGARIYFLPVAVTLFFAASMQRGNAVSSRFS